MIAFDHQDFIRQASSGRNPLTTLDIGFTKVASVEMVFDGWMKACNPVAKPK